MFSPPKMELLPMPMMLPHDPVSLMAAVDVLNCEFSFVELIQAAVENLLDSDMQ